VKLDTYDEMLPAVSHQDQAALIQLLPTADSALDRGNVPFSQYIFSLRKHWWKVAAFCAACLLITYIVSKRITPVYESTVSLEIDRQSPSGVVGQDAARSAWNDSDQYIATQVKIIQQDSVLRPVALRYGLVKEAEDSTSAPVKLKQLRIIRPPNTYLVQISYRSADRLLAANVANGIAESYLLHIFHGRLEDSKSQTNFMERQLDELRAVMEKSSMAVSDFEKRLGVIDPQEKTNILSARLLQLNTEYTNAQADRIKKEAQYTGVKDGSMPAAQESEQGESLKHLQDTLNEANQKFVEIKEHFGPKHPEYVRQASLISELQSQLDQTKQSVGQRSLVSYQDALHREEILRQELGQAKASYDELNAKSYQYQTLKIEAESNRKLYDDLEQRIKEAGINANFQNSTTHISDAARPARKPLYPDIPLNLGLAFGFSLLLGTAAAILYDAADDTVQDTTQISAVFRTEVLGVIPELREQKGLLLMKSEMDDALVAVDNKQADSNLRFGRLAKANKNGTKDSEGSRYSRYEESIRMLWSSFQLTNFGNKFRSLMITSAMSGEGKTTLCMQLALANARHDKKTLLVDADLRRPSTHRGLGLPMAPGLVDAIGAPEAWRAFLHTSTLNPNLHILTAGVAERGSLDHLVHFLPRLLAEGENEFDLIVVDSPPLLAFAESLHMATAVDGVLVVVCADKTSRRALTAVMRTLRRLRANVAGIVLNRAQQGQADGYYNYSQYYSSDVSASA